MIATEVVTGFQACGASAGLRPDGTADVALIYSKSPCTAAAVFTTNIVQAAPVVFDRALLQRNSDKIHAIVVNAKNANAVTGDQGMLDATQMAALTAEALHISEDSVFVISTGVIGVPMPMEKIASGIAQAAQALQDGSLADAARAIMTTDTHAKIASRLIEIEGKTVTMAGIAKGAGMIHPDMATMLAAIITDAEIDPDTLDKTLRYAVDRSFHCISVDGDTSTNDTCVLLANGASGARVDTNETIFRDALTDILQDLARQIAFDGEGATRSVTIQINGARTFEDARTVGRTIATSPLVKTAIYGKDANWGRVLAAAGRAGVDFDPAKASLTMGDLRLLENGAPMPSDEARALALLEQREVAFTLDLGAGSETATVWTCDFSHEYVSINGDYRT